MSGMRPNYRLLSRLAITGIAAVLLMLALAYWWQGNLFHELVGVAVFALLIGHNLINRWWYGTVLRTPPVAQRWAVLIGNFALLAPMLVLLITSVLISQSVFSALPLDASTMAREIHILAAYWVIAIFAVHLGMHWTIVMGAMARTFGLRSPSRMRTMVLRAVAVAIATYGAFAIAVMGFGGKLVDPYVLDMWDFQARMPEFLLNYAAIVGLIATLAHYGLRLLSRSARRA